ncbi:MAG: stage V sporulation protein AB [Tissierellaceae bacterium]|jgi:stage V sporulation protein AB|nr:stage V sporulation protein AB [Tissierellia bacterium]
MVELFMILLGLSGGLIVGGALAAFVTLLEIIQRLVQISETPNHLKLYQNAYTLGAITFTLSYFYDFHIDFDSFLIGIIGLLMGTFTGIFSSALAEVLNVIPVMSKKLKLKNDSKLMIYALLFGKVAGSLYYWLIIK